MKISHLLSEVPCYISRWGFQFLGGGIFSPMWGNDSIRLEIFQMGGSTTTYLEAKYFKWPLFWNGKGPSLGGFHPKIKDKTGSRGSYEFSGSKTFTPPYEPFEPPNSCRRIHAAEERWQVRIASWKCSWNSRVETNIANIANVQKQKSNKLLVLFGLILTNFCKAIQFFDTRFWAI